MTVEQAAAAIANARGGRRGMPAIANVLELLPPNLREEVLEDARAALEAAGGGCARASGGTVNAAERLAEMLPIEVIELILLELPRVRHAGVSRIELHHGPDGRITDGEVAAAPPRAKVMVRRSHGAALARPLTKGRRLIGT